MSCNKFISSINLSLDMFLKETCDQVNKLIKGTYFSDSTVLENSIKTCIDNILMKYNIDQLVISKYSYNDMYLIVKIQNYKWNFQKSPDELGVLEYGGMYIGSAKIEVYMVDNFAHKKLSLFNFIYENFNLTYKLDNYIDMNMDVYFYNKIYNHMKYAIMDMHMQKVRSISNNKTYHNFISSYIPGRKNICHLLKILIKNPLPFSPSFDMISDIRNWVITLK